MNTTIIDWKKWRVLEWWEMNNEPLWDKDKTTQATILDEEEIYNSELTSKKQ